MDLGLYDMDLSLFGGDLLVGLPPTSAELKLTQDVQESTDIVASTWATDLDVSLGQNELADSTSLSSSAMGRPLDMSWMDSRVDLLDLLAQEGEHVLVNNADMASAITGVPAEDSAIKVLQSMAEETTQMLASGANPELDVAAVAQAADTIAQEVVTMEEGSTSVDHLLDMLATGVDPVVDAGVTPVDSDILTSVTAEDVESLLSSEPSSPAAPLASTTFNELPPEQSNSLLAKYLIGELGTGHVSQSQTPSFDISDLDSLTSDVHSSDDDSDYVPPSSYRVSKTRGTPYSRSKATKSGPKSKALDKEARALDRKLRKKQQNKDAATRYRQKKREEAGQIDQECQDLEDRNKELRDKVDQMTREIGYLKNLLAEVYKARGLLTPKMGK